MSCRRMLWKAVGVLIIVFGVGLLAMWGGIEYVYYRPVDRDIASILSGEVPTYRSVRVRGRLSPSTFTVVEKEKETGEVRGIRSVHRLTEESGGERLSIYVVDGGSLEKGKEVVVEGLLLYNAYDLPGYVIVEREMEVAIIRWTLICAGPVFVLLGIAWLRRRPR